MTGRTVVVTGANSGLGYEVARYLCEGGNDVILACRSEDKGNRAVDKIKAKNPNALATYMQLDLADTESIQKFVEEFKKLDKKLHSIVCNAGVCAPMKDTKRQYTKQNFELTMGINHLGHFLLTNLLLEDLKKAGGEENGDAQLSW
jgi:NAD(P)-dependent dehydrogenase (short-subunit alcohol dehydrogenase family)